MRVPSAVPNVFKFDLSKFYNDQTQLNASVANLAKEINASSKTSRLWICAAGPFEVVYRGILAADPAKRQYCTIVYHSPMNEKPDKWEGAHGKDHCVALGVEYKSIRTGNGCTNAFGSGKCSSWELVDWLKYSTDEDFRWIYSRLRATYAEKNKLDASADIGIEKVHLFLGNNGWEFKGADLEIPYEWNLGKLPVGSYKIRVTSVANNGEKVTTSISFEIQ